MLCDIDRDEFITFQKYFLNNGVIGYISLRANSMDVVFVVSTSAGKVQKMLIQTTASNPRVIIDFMIICSMRYLKPVFLMLHLKST